jgi:hypothetical protein
MTLPSVSPPQNPVATYPESDPPPLISRRYDTCDKYISVHFKGVIGAFSAYNPAACAELDIRVEWKYERPCSTHRW